MAVQHCIMSTDEEAAELESEKERTGLSKTDILLSRATKSGAWRANRVRGPVTASTVAAEEAAKLRWWAGDPHSSECWSALDHILEAFKVASRDHRAELLLEMALLRPDVVSAAYALHLTGHDPALLVRAAFEEWFAECPEKQLGSFSISDLAKLLVCDGAIDHAAVLAQNADNRNEVLAMHYAAADRCGEAERRAHAQRILGAWRARGISWPKIEIGRNGAPYLSDGTRVEFQIVPYKGASRREPRLVSEHRPESTPEPIEPSPRPNQIGQSLEALQRLAANVVTGAKIDGVE